MKMNPQQLTLFDLSAISPISPPPIHDPYWDEECATVEPILRPSDLNTHADSGQFFQKEFVPEQSDSVLDQSFVLEHDTQKSVPEHKASELADTTVVPEHIKMVLECIQLEFLQWIEIYRPSKRKANDYYRYCFKQGRKIHHIHISGGNTRSPLAQDRKEEIEIAIAEGQTPAEIQVLIRSWKS